MTRKDPYKFNALSVFTRYLAITRGASLISSLGLLSTGLVWAQTDTNTNSSLVSPNPITTVPTSTNVVKPKSPTVVKPPAPAAPVVSAPAPVIKKPAPVVSAPAPKPVTPTYTAPRRSAPETFVQPPTPPAAITPPQPKPVISAPSVSVPATPRIVTPPTINRAPVANQRVEATITHSPVEGKNSYIDNSSQYNIGTTGGTSRTGTTGQNVTVVLTERSTGCKTMSQQGQLTQGSCNVAVQQPTKKPLNTTVASASTPRKTSYTRPASYVKSNSYANRQNKARPKYNYQSFSQASPVQTMASSKSYSNYYEKTGRPVYFSNENTGLLFPLSVPSAISSAFGWRLHPISGRYRMHTGSDIAAPMGTPVLAAYIGRVAFADYMGGYGLTVVVRHTQDGKQESRYAHLSQIFVKPGEVVQQGEIIGLVGSTGNSTGPHLHFEWRHLMPSGWVPVDPGLHLEYAMYDLVNTLQTAQLNSVTGR